MENTHPAERVLLLAPSQGLGGGIERYLSTFESAFNQHGVACRRIDLIRPDSERGPLAKMQFVRDIVREVRASPCPVRLVVAHNNLLPVLRIVSPMRNFAGATAILYGCDIWSGRLPRGWRMMRRGDVRVVTISHFSAGALAMACQKNVNVLHPGIAPEWHQSLVRAAGRGRPARDHIELITVFRLEDWSLKGLDTLLDAIRLVDDDRIRLTVCGSGPIPPDLTSLIARHPGHRIAASLSDDDLAEHLAAADLCVLATRTRYGKSAYGEGFGIVLVEAQLAGTPVIGPAHGGSWDTFQPGLTGLAPTDESAEALARVLAAVTRNRPQLTEMGHAATSWSRARFEPNGYAKHAVEMLLGHAVAPTRVHNPPVAAGRLWNPQPSPSTNG